MVKRLRRRPLTAKSAVRFRLEVPTKSQPASRWLFLLVPLPLASLAVASQLAESNPWSRLRRLHRPLCSFPFPTMLIASLQAGGFFCWCLSLSLRSLLLRNSRNQTPEVAFKQNKSKICFEIRNKSEKIRVMVVFSISRPPAPTYKTQLYFSFLGLSCRAPTPTCRPLARHLV